MFGIHLLFYLKDILGIEQGAHASCACSACNAVEYAYYYRIIAVLLLVAPLLWEDMCAWVVSRRNTLVLCCIPLCQNTLGIQQIIHVCIMAYYEWPRRGREDGPYSDFDVFQTVFQTVFRNVFQNGPRRQRIPIRRIYLLEYGLEYDNTVG